MTTRKYGWRPDKPDIRDHVLHTAASDPFIAMEADLRKTNHLPPVYEQGELGSCTGNAIAAAIQYALKSQSKPDIIPSRLFIYYNERLMEGTVPVDAGAEIRNGIKSVAKQGVCGEPTWPYEVSKFADKPSDEAYKAAEKGIIKQYSRVPVTQPHIQSVLSHNIPIVFGCSLYESFNSEEVARTGMVPMPGENEKYVGGHCMLLVGYNNTHFVVRNSWGSEWGDGGYCYMPIPYLINTYLADDFWAIFLA